MKTYLLISSIEAKNEEQAKQEFTECIGYDFDSQDNFFEVQVYEESAFEKIIVHNLKERKKREKMIAREHYLSKMQ